MLVKLKKILLLLAVCSTIIENMGGVPLYICIAYFVVSVSDYASFNNIGYYKGLKTITILWVCLFIYLSLITGFISNEAYLSSFAFKWIKSLLLFIFVLKDSFNQPKLLIKVVVSYSLTALLCAVLMMNGIGIELDPSELGEERLTFLGTNANKMAMVFVYTFTLSMFMIDRYAKDSGKQITKFKMLPYLFLMTVCIFLLANIASRGAFVCVFIELFYFFFLYQKTNSTMKNLLIVVFGLILVVIGYEFISNISIFSQRMEMTAEGDYGQRDVLVKAAWNIFVDNPIFGVGLTEVMNIIGSYLGKVKTPHNLYFYILSAGGIIAFSLFMTILYNTIKIVYKYGYKNKKLLPVLLLICILIDYAKNGGALTTSVNYVFFAIALNVCFFSNNNTIISVKSKQQ